jgi:ribosome silencing factor RsfS/YbeB/iojap
MDIRKLQRVIVDALEDVKAQDIKVFNTSHLTALFDRVIVASGTSNRQTKALASSVREGVKEAGGDIVSTEGEDIGEWVLVDCNRRCASTTTSRKSGATSRSASSCLRLIRSAARVRASPTRTKKTKRRRL